MDENNFDPFSQAYNDNSYTGGYNEVPQYPMKWFKFIIYFQLFANALLNISNGVTAITGYMYDERETAAILYYLFPSMEILDKVYGYVAFIFAALAIYTRFRLAKFKKDGPMFYYILLIVQVTVNVGYMFVAGSITGQSFINASTLLNPVVSLAMLVYTKKYFDTRASLFVN